MGIKLSPNRSQTYINDNQSNNLIKKFVAKNAEEPSNVRRTVLAASETENLVSSVVSLLVSSVQSLSVIVGVAFAFNIRQRNQSPTAHNSQNLQIRHFTKNAIEF